MLHYIVSQSNTTPGSI